jgi:hypothetical protein
MVQELYQEVKPADSPADDIVSSVTIRDVHSSQYIEISGEWKDRIMESLRLDWADMPLSEKEHTVRASHSYPLLRFEVQTTVGKKTYSYVYPLISTMKHSQALMYELYSLPAYARISAAKYVLANATGTKMVTIGYYTPLLWKGGGGYRAQTLTPSVKEFDRICEILNTGIERAENGEKVGDRSVAYISVNSSYTYQKYTTTFPIRLTVAEISELGYILQKIEKYDHKTRFIQYSFAPQGGL